MKRLRLFVGACVLLCAFFGAPIVISAHATPILYDPPSGGRVDIVPAFVTVNYSERLEKGASRITLFYPDGTKSDGAEFFEDPRAMRIPVVGGTEGNYTVSWKVVSSDDGHFTSGAFGFSVGSTSTSVAPATFSVIHRSSSLDAVAVSMELFGEGILLSLFLFLLFIVRPLRTMIPSAGVSVSPIRMVKLLGLAGGILLALGSLLFLYENTLLFLGNVGGDSWKEALGIFSATNAGFYAWVQTIAGLLASTLFVFTAKRLWAGGSLGVSGWISLVLIGISVFARARVSHAAASHVFPEFSVGVNVLHLIGKHGWIDLLFVLSVLTPALLREFGKVRHILMSMYHRAEILLSFMFALTGVTGSYIVWLHLKDFSNMGTTLWGTRSLVLLLATGIFVAFRLANHLRFRRIERGGADPVPLRVWYAAEFGAGMIVAVATAITILTTPPVDMPRQGSVIHSQGTYMHFLPSRTEDDTFTLRLEEQSGRVLPVRKITILATNRDVDISDAFIDAERRSVGSFVIPVGALSPQGNWTLRVNMEREGAYDAVGTFSVTTPVSPPKVLPRWDYTILFGVVALGAALLGAWMVMGVRRRESSQQIALSEPTQEKGNISVFLVVFCVALFTAGISFGLTHTLFLSQIEKACAKEGLMWHSSVPMREGTPTSATARDGCSFHVGDKMYHVTTLEEFLFIKTQYPGVTFVGMDHNMHH